MKFIKNVIKYYKNKNRADSGLIDLIFGPLIIGAFGAAVIGAPVALIFNAFEVLKNGSVSNLSYYFSICFNSLFLLFWIVHLIIYYFRMKEEYASSYQEMYKLINNMSEDNVFIKKVNYIDDEDKGYGFKMINYEIVIDEPSFIICLYKKDDKKYNYKIDKITKEETKNLEEITHYLSSIEKKVIQIEQKKKKDQKLKKEQQEIEEVDEFFKNVSTAFRASSIGN